MALDFLRGGGDGGVQVFIRAQPGAKRSAIVGIHGQRLKIAINAPPVDGKANAAIAQFLAELLDLPQRSVVVGAGLSSRDKRVDIDAQILHVQTQLELALAQPAKK